MRGLAAALVSVLWLAPSAEAQARSGGTSARLWGPDAGVERWSVLAPLADLFRAHPVVGRGSPGLLEGTVVRPGLFWFAGNPAALPFEVADGGSHFSLTQREVDGAYRRPLDPGRERSTSAMASGVQRLGAHGAGVARAVVTDAAYRQGVFSSAAEPYGSSPYAIADTAGSNLDQLSTALEASAGWESGGWSVGLGAGFQGQETRTVASPVPRRFHSAGPAASVGVARAVRDGGLRLGFVGRWQSMNETVRTFTVAAPTRIYQIAGYRDPPPLDISALYERRRERESWSLGAGAAGSAGTLDWTLWAQWASAEEVLFNERANDPDSDHWRADGPSFGLVLQRPVAGLHLSAGLTWRGVSGEAEPALTIDEQENPPADTVAFSTDEYLLTGEVGLRGPVGDGRWQLAAVLILEQRRHERRDRRLGVGSDLDVRTAGLAAEVLRQVTDRIALSGGGRWSTFDPTGTIPDPDALGPEYRRWVAPELALLGTPATRLDLTFGARWHVNSEHLLWLRLVRSSLDPGGTASRLPYLPQGDRSSWQVTLGVRLGSASGS